MGQHGTHTHMTFEGPDHLILPAKQCGKNLVTHEVLHEVTDGEILVGID